MSGTTEEQDRGFLFENSIFLIVGAVVALIWANLHHEAYHELVHWSPWGDDHLNLHFIVNDVLMALFFAIAAKEVWESFLPGGALSTKKKAAMPLMATLGGVAMPALLYLIGAQLIGSMDTLGRGWAVPCATDIAFSYLVARFIFGKGHPAIAFLLLLAIADDAAGLIILAAFYPKEAIEPQWFLLTGFAVLLGLVMHYKLRVVNFWYYLLIPGIISWMSFYKAHVHPALGLLPLIPTLPHAKSDLGIFASEELERSDTLSAFEHWWKNPVELILGLFGLVNAGVIFSSFGAGAWLVLAGLMIGKPIGITLFVYLGKRFLNLKLPDESDYRHIVCLGMVAGIGFTVSLFVGTAAFPNPGFVQDSVKMGALGSFLAAALAIGLARVLKIKKMIEGAEEVDAGMGGGKIYQPATETN